MLRPSALIGVSLTIFSGAPAVHALGLPEIPETNLSIGPSLAWADREGSPFGFMHGFDAAFRHFFFFWGGGGIRSYETFRDEDRAFYPYVEVGGYLIVNVGAGVTMRLQPSDATRFAPHLFVGLPVPIDDPILIFEPYYRPTYFSDGMVYELGAMLKWPIFFDDDAHSKRTRP